MRKGTVQAFARGFLLGMVALGSGLWFTGAVNMPPGLRTWLSPVRAPAEAPPLVPVIEAGFQSSGDSGAPLHAATETEDDQALRADHLVVPLAGVAPAELHDTFHDARTGHEHHALDIPAPRDTPVLAAVEGKVAKLFHSVPGGLTVYEFDNSQTYCYYYAHLDHYAEGLENGGTLRQGQVLGYVGTTGNAPPNAPHLHFAVFRLGPKKSWWKGTAVDPLPLLHPQP